MDLMNIRCEMMRTNCALYRVSMKTLKRAKLYRLCSDNFIHALLEAHLNEFGLLRAVDQLPPITSNKSIKQSGKKLVI